jgi:hypothetical protein
MKFSLFASNGGHTGGTDGTVPLVNNLAVYKAEKFAGDPGYIKMKFNGRYAEISGRDTPFCGAAVTLTGSYEKKDDRRPVFSD